MKKTLKLIAAAAGLGLILSGCATQSISTYEPFQAEDLDYAVQSGILVNKTENLYVIIDSSSSMSDIYEGEGYPSGLSKLSVEKEVLNRMNLTIPNIQLNTAIRSFGWGKCLGWGSTELNEGLNSYSTSGFSSALDSLECSSGGSPLHAALEDAKEDLASAPGKTTVLILSDGHNLDASPISAAMDLEAALGDKLCIFGVWTGNDEESSGRYTLQQLSDIAGCGYTTSVATVASAPDMAGLVEAMLFDRHEMLDPDSDGDGVPDSRDKCPNTPKGAKVDVDGCWAYHGVFFDFDKATVKAEYKPLFDNAVEVMNLNPGLEVEIQGHTDSVGPESYNMGLSIRRAQAVKDYMVAHGIAASRLTVKGFGESDPARSNDTEEGRAYNRRVYFSITKR
jgi:OmpA-OmpF porin, OOP family